MRYLNVAEKNSAAKGIAKHLSDGTYTWRDGLFVFNKIYVFEADVNGEECEMVMTSVSGHLKGLKFQNPQYNSKNWRLCHNLLELFDSPVTKYCLVDEKTDRYRKIEKTLKEEVRRCDGLIIWTDCDREGENIGYEIIEVCRAVKSNLPVFRAKFSSITPTSVDHALQNLIAPKKSVSDAVDVRQELDFKIGAAFTRFHTLRLQEVFPSEVQGIVSYGSCQFPTLGFVVERYKDVEDFKEEPFWVIKVIHTMNDLRVEFLREPQWKMFEKDVCQTLYDTCKQSPHAEICDVKTEEVYRQRPPPLVTVELEKLASRVLRITAKKAMELVENLYCLGCVSYPRTETNSFPEDMDETVLTELLEEQTWHPEWGRFAQRILESGGPTPREGNKSDNAHPPIYPIKIPESDDLPSHLKQEDRENIYKLYELIVRSFLACCSEDAQALETTVAIAVAGERFSAMGRKIIARNYLDVYPYDEWPSIEIHVYETGKTFDPTSIDMEEGKTSPPELLTEADLIDLMDHHGIGTDATHAGHIETLRDRRYVYLEDNIHFQPTPLGLGLIEGYEALEPDITKPTLRAQLEEDLKNICEGNKQPQEVLTDQIEKYKAVYRRVTSNAWQIDLAVGRRLAERPNQHTYTPRLQTPPRGVNVQDDNDNVTCFCGLPAKQSIVRKESPNKGRNFYSCPKFPSADRCRFFEFADGASGPSSSRKRRASSSPSGSSDLS